MVDLVLFVNHCFSGLRLTEAKKRTALVTIVFETEHAANENTIQGFGSDGPF
jgi:hypothetical protein